MKIAYLILAHENPRLLERTIRALSCRWCAFFVHIDRKSDLDDFRLADVEAVYLSNERIEVYWAEYSMVEAILLLLLQALECPTRYDYFVLLSGSDYPIKPNEYIQRYIATRAGTQFVSMARIPNGAAGLPLSKITALSFSRRRHLLYSAARALTRLGLNNRDYTKALDGLEPYGGSTWWALSRDAARYVVTFAQSNPRVCRFFAHSETPDETFFHTILGNSPYAKPLHRSLTYDDWSHGGLHPAPVTERHIAAFRSEGKATLSDAFGPGEMLFARKFSDHRLDLVESVDEMIKQTEYAYE